MNTTIPAQLSIGGEIRAIPSKACAHRMLICAALSGEPSAIRCGQSSDDMDATARCLNALGARITRLESGWYVAPIAGDARGDTAELDVGESGTTLRFMLPLCAALGARARLRMRGRLPHRPIAQIADELARHGYAVERSGDTISCGGKLGGDAFEIPGNVSSQFVSGLLLAMPLLGGGTLRVPKPVESLPYIMLTISMMREYRAAVEISETGDAIVFSVGGKYCAPAASNVEGDWSDAAIWLCAAAIGRNALTVTNLNPDSAQGDRRIAGILKDFGADVRIGGDSVNVAPSALRGREINVQDVPDLAPPLAVMACAARGVTRICGAGRLRLKECDRLSAICAMLNALGADVAESADGLEIIGGKVLHGGEVDSFNDHRMAMAAAAAATISSGDVTVKGSECVSKSHPSFFEDLASITIPREGSGK